MWDLPGPGIEPMSPALAGRFLTTEPPGKSLCFCLYLLASPAVFALYGSCRVIWYINICKCYMFTVSCDFYHWKVSAFAQWAWCLLCPQSGPLPLLSCLHHPGKPPFCLICSSSFRYVSCVEHMAGSCFLSPVEKRFPVTGGLSLSSVLM